MPSNHPKRTYRIPQADLDDLEVLHQLTGTPINTIVLQAIQEKTAPIRAIRIVGKALGLDLKALVAEENHTLVEDGSEEE